MVDVMALLDESKVDPALKCTTCAWLKTRPDEERSTWEDALRQPKTFSNPRIARAMSKVPREKDDPRVPPSSSIANHRTGHMS